MSQRIIKSIPKLKSNPSKLKTFLSIALVCSPFYTNAIEYCAATSQVSERDVVDNGYTNMITNFSVADLATIIDTVNYVSLKIVYEFLGGFQTTFSIPVGSNIHLFTLESSTDTNGTDHDVKFCDDADVVEILVNTDIR